MNTVIKVYTLTTRFDYEISTAVFATEAQRDRAYRDALIDIASAWNDGDETDDLTHLDASALQSYLDASNALDDYEFALGEHVVDIASAPVVEPSAEAA